MKRIALSLFAACLVLLACNSNEKKETKKEGSTDSTTIVNDNKAPADKWVPVDSATTMKAWMEYATPGKMHEMMASWNGTWTGEITSWMSEGATPSKSTTTAVNSMVFGGRYQSSHHTSSFDGMPFEGMSWLGYDNSKKIFVSTWVDNMGTGMMNMSGPWDEATKTITLTGKQTDPARGNDCTVRETFKIIDDNNQLMEMYGPDPMTGKEFKTMEIKLTRKK